MKGHNHIIIQVNELDEIRNYSLSLDITNNLNYKYEFLIQCEYIYKESIFKWIKEGIEIMNNNYFYFYYLKYLNAIIVKSNKYI